jgi:hypothetical protein
MYINLTTNSNNSQQRKFDSLRLLFRILFHTVYLKPMFFFDHEFNVIKLISAEIFMRLFSILDLLTRSEFRIFPSILSKALQSIAFASWKSNQAFIEWVGQIKRQMARYNAIQKHLTTHH